MLTRCFMGLLGVALGLSLVAMHGETCPEPVEKPTATKVATSENGRRVILPDITVDALHEATRSGINVLNLQVGDALDFALDDAIVRVEQISPFCTLAMTSSTPLISTPTAHPWIGRASATVGVSRATGCPSAVNFSGSLVWGASLHNVAAQSPLITVPAGQAATRVVSRECNNVNQNSFQSLVTWTEGVALQSTQTSTITNLRCGF